MNELEFYKNNGDAIEIDQLRKRLFQIEEALKLADEDNQQL